LGNVLLPYLCIENWVLVFEFKLLLPSPRNLWQLPTAHRANNSIREEETAIIGSHEPLFAIVKKWKINWLSWVARQPGSGTPFGRKQPEKQDKSVSSRYLLTCKRSYENVCTHTIQDEEIPGGVLPAHKCLLTVKDSITCAINRHPLKVCNLLNHKPTGLSLIKLSYMSYLVFYMNWIILMWIFPSSYFPSHK
jgi:hypothetical protein